MSGDSSKTTLMEIIGNQVSKQGSFCNFKPPIGNAVRWPSAPTSEQRLPKMNVRTDFRATSAPTSENKFSNNFRAESNSNETMTFEEH